MVAGRLETGGAGGTRRRCHWASNVKMDFTTEFATKDYPLMRDEEEQVKQKELDGLEAFFTKKPAASFAMKALIGPNYKLKELKDSKRASISSFSQGTSDGVGVAIANPATATTLARKRWLMAGRAVLNGALAHLPPNDVPRDSRAHGGGIRPHNSGSGPKGAPRRLAPIALQGYDYISNKDLSLSQRNTGWLPTWLDDTAAPSPRAGDRCLLSPIHIAKERARRPVMSRELLSASLPTPISVLEFPPIVKRNAAGLKETHYEYFARRCPDESPQHRRVMEHKSRVGKRMVNVNDALGRLPSHTAVVDSPSEDASAEEDEASPRSGTSESLVLSTPVPPQGPRSHKKNGRFHMRPL